MYKYKVKVVSVHDGDTFTGQIDLGFDMSYKTTFRLYGVDTPELNIATQKDKGILARDFVASKINGKDIVIDSIKVEGDKEKYGRYLAKVTFIDDDKTEKDLASLVISKGYGVAYFGGKKEQLVKPE